MLWHETPYQEETMKYKPEEIPNNYFKPCGCGCKTMIPHMVKYGNGSIYIRKFAPTHQLDRSSYWNIKPQVKSRTSRERAMKILRKAGRTVCEINNDDCSHKKLESHHIDENPFNNDITNLVPLCIIHHKIIERRKLSIVELKGLKLDYYITKKGERRLRTWPTKLRTKKRR